MITRTGIFATSDELAELTGLVEKARDTPVIAMSISAALAGRDFSRVAWDHVTRTCHEYALQHGLPEIPGYYGIHGGTGEFVSDSE